MQWFRMYAEAVDDEKLRLLAYDERWHFVAILCLKSQGTLDNLDATLHRRVAIKLGLRLDELDAVKAALMGVGLIDENFQPVAWDRRQYASDSPAYKAEKQRRYRQKSNSLRNGDVTVTTALPPRTDTEQIQNRGKTLAPTRAEKPARSVPKVEHVRFVNGQEDPVGHFEVAKEIRMQWLAAYPAVQIGTELEKAAAWAAANPTKRKKDWRRFLNNWMSRCQERTR